MSSDRGPDEPDGTDIPDVPDVADVLHVTALAALDADLTGSAAAAQLRAAARTNPRAAAVLDALAATRADLAALPETPVPTEVEARWAAALAAAAAAGSPRARGRREMSGRPDTARDGQEGTSGPRARRLLLAVAVTVCVVAAGIGFLPHPDAREPVVTHVELVALGRDAVGTMDVGDLTDPARRAACLRKVAPTAEGAPLLGGRRVVLGGSPGTLLVLGTGTLGRLRLVVVDPHCGTLLAHVVSG